MSVTVDPQVVQRRTIGTLVVSQAVGAVGITIGLATASLLARDVSGSDTQAGLAQTFMVLGAAVTAYLLARVMAVRGRRVGLSLGYLIGAAGAGLAVIAADVESMALLLLGAGMLGATTAANNSARYAATDLASERTRARALSVVVWATTIGAVAGPNFSGVSGDLARALGLPTLAGPFLIGAVAMTAASAYVWVRLRPDPLFVARDLAADIGSPQQPSATEDSSLEGPVDGAFGIPAAAANTRQSSWRLTLDTVREHPVLGWAITGLAGAHAAMIGVMVMTPLHMEHGGASLQVIGLVISVHVLGMFAFAPVMGFAADRLGRAGVLSAGGVVLLVSLVLCAWSPEGSSGRIFTGLFLLGLGWSAATVAASTLISDHTPLAVRTDVQGTADLIMGLGAAAAGGVAGVLTGWFGYPVLATSTICVALLVVLAGVRGGRLASRSSDPVAPLPS